MDQRNDQRPESAEDTPRDPVPRGPGPAGMAATSGSSAPAGETARQDEAGPGDKADDPEPSVADAGTSQKLVLIDHSDDASFFQAATGADGETNPHPSHASRDEERETEPVTKAGEEHDLVIVPEGESAEKPRLKSRPPEDSLVIVRDMADQFALDEHAALKPEQAESPSSTHTPAPFQPKKKPKREPEPAMSAEDAADAERRRELADVLGVDWDSELGGPAKRPSRPASSALHPVGPLPAPTRSGRPTRKAAPEPRPADLEPELLEPPPSASRPVAIASALIFLAATVLMALRVEPFHTWYYLFAWYPMLLVVNHRAATRAPRFSIFRGRAGALGTMIAWSVPIWLFFEVLNFRISNWYYVGVPDVWVARRLGVIFAFATVVPGIFLLEEMLRSRGWYVRTSTRTFRIPPALPHAMVALAAIWTLLVFALPQFFFPLVWGIPVLALEPLLLRGRGPSLLRDLSEGRPGLLLRLLAVGLFCGVFWETANYFAGGKWIYTVPGFDRVKLFEMPFLGFAGFPPFALCCWVMVQGLVRVGLLLDPEPREQAEPEPEPEYVDEDAAWLAGATRKRIEPVPDPPFPREVRIAGIVGAVLFSLAVLEFVDRVTVDSFTARPENVPAIPDGVAEYAHGHGAHDVRGLLRLIEEGSLYMPGSSSANEITVLQETCELILLHGIGTENARRLGQVDIHSVGDLAIWQPDELVAALAQIDEPGWKPKPRRVSAWVGAARREFSRQ